MDMDLSVESSPMDMDLSVGPSPGIDARVNLPPWTTLPYKSLVLTDIEYQGRPAPEEIVEDPNKLRLYEEFNLHTKVLCDGGAAGPFSRISGFDSNGLEFTPFHKMQQNMAIGLCYWGSPHWGSLHVEECTKGWKDSNQFKTNAFESMSWLAGQAIVAMVYPCCYRVELWSPNFRLKPKEPETRIARQLIVDRAYARQYVPLASGDSYAPMAKGDGGINVALLVPHKYLSLVTYRENSVDIGMTFYKALRACQQEQQLAIELGGQTFSLSYEIHLAKMELDCWPSTYST